MICYYIAKPAIRQARHPNSLQYPVFTHFISRIAISNKVSANAPDKMRSKHTEMPLNDIPGIHYKARLESARMGNAILPIQVNHSCAGHNVAHI